MLFVLYLVFLIHTQRYILESSSFLISLQEIHVAYIEAKSKQAN